VAHLAALEACTWIPTEFCETSSAARYFHADFVAHKEAFIIFSDALLCRFSTVKFLRRLRQGNPQNPSKIPTTKPYPTLQDVNQVGKAYNMGETYFNSMLMIFPILPKQL
jgi:hypothetical protein